MMFVAWALAEVASASAAVPLQTQFEQASAALADGKWAEAATAFKLIAARPGLSNRTRGVVLVREGTALRHTGQDDQALELLREGLAIVPRTDPALKGDLIDALLAKGGIERGNYDYPAAGQDFRDALALVDGPADKVRCLMALASVTMFDDAKAALGYMDEAVKIAAGTKVAPEVDAMIRDMRGKVLLNMGDYSAALADLQIALKDQGGLTSKTDLDDVMVRSDLAIAALKAKQMDKAREYLAMTGEGRLPEGPFAVPADTNLPPCGGDLRPDDVVVVEFGIGDDGRVAFANPVYASRPGSIATDFARAVYNWSWQPSSIKSIPPFYRAVTRVELRCSVAIGRPGEIVLLAPAVNKWLSDNGAAIVPETDDRSPEQLRKEIEKHGDRPIERIPYLLALASKPVTEEKESEAALDQAVVIADQFRSPTSVTVYLRVLRLGEAARNSRAGLGLYRTGLRALLARPEVLADAQSADVLRLLVAAPALGSIPADAPQFLQQVVDDTRLDAHDPLRVGALIRLSSVQKQRGNVDAARATYLKTGLSAQQCSLVDAQPTMRRQAVGSSDYPADAYKWGIGGWTQIEFDVLPDGKTENRRAVMSYPPFTFGDSTVSAMSGTRYTQTYRPDGAVGCSGASQRFRYVAPQH
jgi:hypothetical protein